MSSAPFDVFETVLLLKKEVFVFRIPPRQTNRNYRANDWNLSQPDWTGRLKIVTNSSSGAGEGGVESSGGGIVIKFEDSNTGNLYAQAPIDEYPSAALESVQDSSRYFVIRLRADNGRTAFIGMGFADRSDSFDFNLTIQEHFKRLRGEQQMAQSFGALGLDGEQLGGGEDGSGSGEGAANGGAAGGGAARVVAQPLDLGFKEGQTIKLKLNTRRAGDDPADNSGTTTTTSRSRPAARGAAQSQQEPFKLLPPPPSASTNHQNRAQKTQNSINQNSTTNLPASTAATTTTSTNNNQSGTAASLIGEQFDDIFSGSSTTLQKTTNQGGGGGGGGRGMQSGNLLDL